MDAKRLFNMERLKFVGLVMGQRQSLELALQTVMLVEGQECKRLDKDQSLCKQCAEFVKVKEESSNILA